AYADQQMSSNRIIALIIVALIHIGLGYVLVTGLAYEAIQKAVERVTTVDIDEPEPEPEEEPPPPPPDEVPVSPPPTVPPSAISIAPPAQFKTEDKPRDDRVVDLKPAPKPAPVPVPPPPPPPPPKFTPKDPTPRGNPGGWASPRDYPSRALREEREGVTRFRVNVGADGKVANCTVTGSSGHSDLDETTCKLISRRGKFNPATNGDGNDVAGTWSSAVRWEIPK
ncbi:MAG: energy transducer TonB, partial [Pontixanthobacter sp.]